MLKLDDKQLDTITGGTWNFDTITPAERDEYDALENARIEAENSGEWDQATDLEQQINAFIDRMNARYGA